MIDFSVYRMRISDRSVELAASTENIDIICPVFALGNWFGLTPDDHIPVLRNRSIEEIYALDLECL